MINARCNNKPEMSKVSKFVELFFLCFFFIWAAFLSVEMGIMKMESNFQLRAN